MFDRNQKQVMQPWKAYSSPLLSICCITFNHEPYISETIDSFLIQETDFPIEILIHDDASTDATATIIKNYEKKYPDIIKPIYQVENQYSKGGGINSRFNFSRAKGKYIALCEGDDYWTDPKKLQIQVDFLESHPEYVITYHDSQPFDKGGYLDTNFWGALKDLEPIELQKATPIFTLTTCFRNIVDPFPFEAQMAKFGDLFIWSVLGEYGKGKFMKDIKPAMYRIHDGGIFSKKTKQQKNEMRLLTFYALSSYHTRRGNTQLADYYQEKIMKISIKHFGSIGIARMFYKSLISRLSSGFSNQ
ncbi:MAG: glycosyltransferase [Gammaproteobacteria bacterium]|nr:glycosyltransferase [Gammaproteobacteria bacterium]